LRESGILNRLAALNEKLDGAYIYGDSAYPLSHLIQVPFKSSAITEEEEEFNLRMSKLRVSVEWCFGKVLSLFPFVDFKKSQKIFLQPVGKYYPIAVLLTNMHTCVEGSLTGRFFCLSPPSLQEYIAATPQ
jgi:hypothetical protein